jgi:tripartite-type tricarboxylate transporter receptor subunit TctC
VLKKLSAAMITAVNDPEIKSKLVAQGITPGGMTPAELSAFQKAEAEKWARVIKEGNIKLE